MGYSFGKNSRKELDTCHEDLVKILDMAIKHSKIDFGISEGHRSVERQNRLYREGKSKIDGINKKGKHNYSPSLAADFYIYHPDKGTRQKLIYDTLHLSYVAGVIDSCAETLFEEGEIKHKIRWGGNWDSDGVISIDQSFDDLPHVELITR